MRILTGAALLCAAAIFCCGCASHRGNGPVYHAGDENPPDFMVGPVMLVLTNLNGFSAHVTCTTVSTDGSARTRQGELLGRDGLLIYQPMLDIKRKRAKTEGGLFFIWDGRRHTGFVMSEALQGYAPIARDSEIAGQLHVAREGITQDINGHPCHRGDAYVGLKDGISSHMTLWEADDEKHFPVRIETVDGTDRITLNFSEIHREFPSQELFLPPEGFTRYANSIALMNELIVRDASYSKKATPQEFDEPVDSRSGTWHENSGFSPMGQQ